MEKLILQPFDSKNSKKKFQDICELQNYYWMLMQIQCFDQRTKKLFLKFYFETTRNLIY